MALFAAIGDRFISKILRQVASDYNLDFEEMKARYCGESSFELSEPVKPKVPKVQGPNVLEVDLEALPAPVKVPKPKAPAKPKAPKVPKPKFTGDTEPEPEKLMALSKMKKPELVAECDSRGLDSEGTVAQLKDRVKEAREADPAATTKGKGKTKPKADPKPKKVSLPPPPPPVPLEEEGDTVDEEGDPDKEEVDPEEDEFEVEAEEDDLQARLRKILAEAEEEEFEEEEEEVEEA
jgi:hypothetical protein